MENIYASDISNEFINCEEICKVDTKGRVEIDIIKVIGIERRPKNILHDLLSLTGCIGANILYSLLKKQSHLLNRNEETAGILEVKIFPVKDKPNSTTVHTLQFRDCRSR